MVSEIGSAFGAADRFVAVADPAPPPVATFVAGIVDPPSLACRELELESVTAVSAVEALLGAGVTSAV